jgi:c(7)-type cytochrome triheme protein
MKGRNMNMNKSPKMKGDKMIKTLMIMITVLAVSMFAVSAMAVPPGKTVEWESSAGKVVFDGKTHADKGLKCNDCHTKIFQMKKGAEMTMEEINKGKFCGACHDGTKAFKASGEENCAKCHKK